MIVKIAFSKKMSTKHFHNLTINKQCCLIMFYNTVIHFYLPKNAHINVWTAIHQYKIVFVALIKGKTLQIATVLVDFINLIILRRVNNVLSLVLHVINLLIIAHHAIAI